LVRAAFSFVVVPVDYAENTRVLVDELRGQVPEIA
jgi:hypothetical protein